MRTCGNFFSPFDLVDCKTITIEVRRKLNLGLARQGHRSLTQLCGEANQLCKSLITLLC